MGLLKGKRRTRDSAFKEAGDLLPVEAIYRNGLAVTSEGAFVRILQVIPPNPLILSAEQRRETAAAYCHLVSRLRPEQSVQFYIDTRPIRLERLLADVQQEIAAWSGPRPDGASDNGNGPLARSRWALYKELEESLRLHADDQAAIQQNAYIVVPYMPRQKTASRLLAQLRSSTRRLPIGDLEREFAVHRRAERESLAHTDAIRSEVEALSLPTRLLNGEEVAHLFWCRFNPTTADAGRRRFPRHTEIFGDLDPAADKTDARRAARRLREAIAESPVDFDSHPHHATVDRDLEQTIYTATTADATFMGWLMGAMMTRQPYTLSVHVHALDRRGERTKAKMRYRRVFGVNRGAEARGRVPDFDRYAQEHESERLLTEMAGHERASIFRVSVYLTPRARGPEPDVALLSEAVDYIADQIESTVDCRVHRGQFQQQQLWETTLPLGRDVARRVRKYATVNVGDTVPLVGTSCGSPDGIPFVFSDPGRTVEFINPFDRAHSNFTMLLAGRSGSGKTMTANILLSRCLALGARAFVLDRAGHYELLTQLVHGAQQIDIGAHDSEYAINPWDVVDPSDVPLEKISFLVDLHAVMMGDEGLTTLERSQLGAAIRAVYARAATMEEVPRESLLRDELIERSRQEASDGSAEISSVLRNLAERLGEFCDQGSYAYLLDRKTTVDPDAALVVFDTRDCPDVVLRPVMFSIMEYTTRAIARHSATNAHLAASPDAPLFTGKSIFLIDEAWHLVGRKETGEYANDLARRARHLGLFLIVMSQHLSDFSTEHGKALLRNATMQLLLAQHPEEIPFIQDALRLSDEEAAVISRLKTVKGSHAQMFFSNGTRGKGQVALRLGPRGYWQATSEPTRDVPVRNQAIDQFGGDVDAAITALAREADPATGDRAVQLPAQPAAAGATTE